ncbi:MAG: carbohydrate ABC transporter permease [Rhodothermia bacterium]|nr:carbohydrate ABC transporter permease [Rhodothermia bacterium]
MSQRFTSFLVNGSLWIVALITAFPLVWMVSVSFMQTGAAGTYPPPLVPSSPTLEQYQTLFERMEMGRYFLNSFLLATSITLFSLLLNAMAGYAFAKLPIPGKERIFKTLMGALVIPAQVAMLPLFLMMKYMGLVNTYLGVMIPGLASIFGIFLIRQYALSVPNELIEAARMDGAGEFRTFWSVILPLLRPILVTLALFTFMGTWNDFMWPLILMTDDRNYTLPVALAALSREHVQDNEMMMAGSVMTVLPVLMVFLVLQKHYIKGIMMGGVKG